MTRRYLLEITKETAVRAGFYKGLPPNPMEWEVAEWYKKEGEVIGGVKNDDTGTVSGEIILRLENSEKGAKDIEAEGWEIGSRITKILLPAGQPVSVDLNKEPLRLAELEVEDEQEPKEAVNERKTAKEPVASQPQKKPPAVAKNEYTGVRITPLAEQAMLELGIELNDVISSISDKTEELTAEHVKEYAAKRASIKAAPKTRQRAKELGIDLRTVSHKKSDGIIRLNDVESAVTVSETYVGAYEVLKPTMRRKGTAHHMTDAWHAPHAGPEIDINPTPLLELRKHIKELFERKHGAKLRIDHFFIAACAYLLKQKEFRILNSYWHDEGGSQEIRLYNNINIGIAVAVTPDKTRSGYSELIVPSVKKAESLGFLEIAKETERLIAEAASGNPKTGDIMDTTFIVNNTGSPVEWHGMRFAGDEFPNSIFAPRTAAILSFGAARDDGDCKKMRLALRFDHRICDGYEPKLFLRALQYLLENPALILIL